MERFVIVVFRLIAPARTRAVKETGGGVAFFPEPRPENWHALLSEMAHTHFAHPLGPCVEVGYATLDRELLERHCQRHGAMYWQGGDSTA